MAISNLITITNPMPRRSASNSASNSPPRNRAPRSPRKSSGSPRRSPARNDYDQEGEPKVYVSGLPEDVQKSDLQNEFRRFGEITDLFVINKSGFSIAFVTFDSFDAVKSAIDQMNGAELSGKTIRCAPARPRPPRNDRGGDRGQGNSRGKGCFKCGEEGHFARECPNPDQGGYRSRGPPSRGEYGRNRDESPRRRHRRRSSSSSRSQQKRKHHSRRRSSSSDSRPKHSKHRHSRRRSNSGSR